jgi:hypothetical protein
MDMTLIEDDDDAGDMLSSMPVGSINITDIEIPENMQDESWRKWYPIWQHPLASAREEIGNCYEMTAEYLLTTFQPYPGDESGTNWSPANRFTVKQVGNMQDFRIFDVFHNYETSITKLRLANPKFNLIHWYAKKRARALELKNPTIKEYPSQLENPVVVVTANLLQSGISSHFPNTKPDSWTVMRSSVAGHEQTTQSDAR